MSSTREPVRKGGALTLALLLPLCACAHSSVRIDSAPTPAFPIVWADQPSLPAQGGGPASTSQQSATSPVPVALPSGTSTPSPVATAVPSPTQSVAVGMPVLDAVAAGDVQVTLVGVHHGEHMEVRVRSAASRPSSLRLGPGRVVFQAHPQTQNTFILDTGEGTSFDLAPEGTASVLVLQAGPTRLNSGSVMMARQQRAYRNANVKVMSVVLAPSPREPLTTCSPGCPSGSACLRGLCTSLCEALCTGGLVCNDDGKCTRE